MSLMPASVVGHGHAGEQSQMVHRTLWAMEFRPFTVELNTRFRGLTSRSGVLIRSTAGEAASAEDATQWGEYSPFADYTAERANRWWQAAMEAARGDWPEPVRDEVPVNAIVPEVDPDRAAEYARAGGCRTAKVKVGGRNLSDDTARIEAVADALGPGGKIRVDVNGTWDVDTAVRALRELEAAARSGGADGLEYAEQPCATVDELAELRRRIDVPIAADESVRIPGNADAVVKHHAADLIILKVNPMGGVQRCLDIAESAGLPVVVSSAMESSVGLAAGVALARALPELPYACGLGTGNLLATDTVRSTWKPINGVIQARTLKVVV